MKTTLVIQDWDSHFGSSFKHTARVKYNVDFDSSDVDSIMIKLNQLKQTMKSNKHNDIHVGFDFKLEHVTYTQKLLNTILDRYTEAFGSDPTTMKIMTVCQKLRDYEYPSAQEFAKEIINEIISGENQDDDQPIIMVFGDEKTIFKGFDISDPSEQDYLDKNDGKVKLRYIGFASEWSDYVDFDNSFAYIENNKLFVVVYGLDFFNEKTVKKYFNEGLEQYIKQGYGEFFETDDCSPMCMIVERDGVEVIV